MIRAFFSHYARDAELYFMAKTLSDTLTRIQHIFVSFTVKDFKDILNLVKMQYIINNRSRMHLSLAQKLDDGGH